METEAFRQWCLCVVAASAAATFVTVIMPKGSMEKTVRAVIGIFVVSVICSPLAKFDKSDFLVEAFADCDYEHANMQELRECMVSSCKTAIDSDIREAAEAFDVYPESVQIQISVDDENCIIIHKIAIKILDLSPKNKEDLSEKLEKKLGVPVEIE